MWYKTLRQISSYPPPGANSDRTKEYIDEKLILYFNNHGAPNRVGEQGNFKKLIMDN